MTDIEENGQRPRIWDFEKYTEIYISPMAFPEINDEHIESNILEELGRIVHKALREHGAAVVIKGEAK